MVRVAAAGRRAALDVGVELLCLAERLGAREDAFGNLGSELAAVLGSAGLKDDGLALGRARDVERACHREELAAMVEGVELALVEEDSAGLVAGESIVLVGISEPLHDSEVLAGAPVA